MISNTATIFFVVIGLLQASFLIWSTFYTKRLLLIHKLYICLCFVFFVWDVAMLGMRFCDPSDTMMLWVWDAITYIGVAYSPAFMLMITLTFVKGMDHQQPWWKWLLVLPTVTNVMVWTNPLHHLHYRVFSVVRSQIVFGPYIIISGIYTWVLMIISMVLIIRFALKNHSRLYMMQSTLFALGELVPVVVSIIATSGLVDLPITATPMSFMVTLICQYIAIYRLHVLDVKPVATQHVLDWISDCYLVLSAKDLVLSNNEPFRKIFGKLYGISENKFLADCVKEEDIVGRTAIYNLLTGVETCRQSGSTISYEQSVTVPQDKGDAQMFYYVVDITPLNININLSGFIVLFKDITQMKKSMQQLQDSQTRMMEQERLAFLGQMVGGLAHNLKTPIMSISGCANAVESLVEEARSSLGDPVVNDNDYREMYAEIDSWLGKLREACSYMSDIITAIKGQAANASASQQESFTLDNLVRRCTLLMRHELMSSGCHLAVDLDQKQVITLTGDINNLVQVINNLITNAIDAQIKDGDHTIHLGIFKDDTNLNLYVKDHGSGLDPRVRDRLFREMATSKGTHGTGLGLYISSAVVKGKFGGHMWVEDNPEGGTTFGVALPLESISITPAVDAKEAAAT